MYDETISPHLLTLPAEGNLCTTIECDGDLQRPEAVELSDEEDNSMTLSEKPADSCGDSIQGCKSINSTQPDPGGIELPMKFKNAIGLIVNRKMRSTWIELTLIANT